jgi:hypothetical protein
VQGDKPDEAVLQQQVVDDAQIPASPLSPPRIPHRTFRNTPRALDDVPCLGIVGEVELGLCVLVLGQVLRQERREERRLDELHAQAIIRKLRMVIKKAGMVGPSRVRLNGEVLRADHDERARRRAAGKSRSSLRSTEVRRGPAGMRASQ